jgi:hypothetical protein
VFDKLTNDLDPAKGQFVENEPNVLLTCFAGAGIEFDRPGVRWGFEELFRCHPTIPRTGVPEGFTDISLEAWAEFRANELIRKGRMTVAWYCNHSHRVLEAQPSQGSAALPGWFRAGLLNQAQPGLTRQP